MLCTVPNCQICLVSRRRPTPLRYLSNQFLRESARVREMFLRHTHAGHTVYQTNELLHHILGIIYAAEDDEVDRGSIVSIMCASKRGLAMGGQFLYSDAGRVFSRVQNASVDLFDHLMEQRTPLPRAMVYLSHVKKIDIVEPICISKISQPLLLSKFPSLSEITFTFPSPTHPSARVTGTLTRTSNERSLTHLKVSCQPVNHKLFNINEFFFFNDELDGFLGLKVEEIFFGDGIVNWVANGYDWLWKFGPRKHDHLAKLDLGNMPVTYTQLVNLLFEAPCIEILGCTVKLRPDERPGDQLERIASCLPKVQHLMIRDPSNSMKLAIVPALDNLVAACPVLRKVELEVSAMSPKTAGKWAIVDGNPVTASSVCSGDVKPRYPQLTVLRLRVGETARKEISPIALATLTVGLLSKHIELSIKHSSDELCVSGEEDDSDSGSEEYMMFQRHKQRAAWGVGICEMRKELVDQAEEVEKMKGETGKEGKMGKAGWSYDGPWKTQKDSARS